MQNSEHTLPEVGHRPLSITVTKASGMTADVTISPTSAGSWAVFSGGRAVGDFYRNEDEYAFSRNSIRHGEFRVADWLEGVTEIA